MILLGCLLVFGLAVAPRAMLVLAWIFSARWPIVWGGDFLAPLLGIIFLPFTTIMYMLVWKPTGIDGWDWMWILLGLFLDILHWQQTIERRKQVPGYDAATAAVTGGSSGSPGASASAARPPATKPIATTPAAAVVPPAAPEATPQPVAPPAASPPDEPGTGPSGT